MNVAYGIPYPDAPQWQIYDERFPWVLWIRHPQGGFELFDQQTGERAYASTWDGVVQFAADHSRRPGKSGLGSLVKGFTSLFGLRRCTPCAKRQIEMDQFAQFPEDWNPFA